MSPFLSLSSRVAGIVRDAIAALALLGPKGMATGPVLVAIHRCVQRRLLRFERLMARAASGRPAVAPQASQAAKAKVKKGAGEKRAGEKRAGTRRVSLVPRGAGWAVAMSRDIASYGSQLQALLAEPGVLEVLRTVPEAAAILRPLCRMLGTPVPDILRPPGWAAKVDRAPPVRRRPKVGEEWIRYIAEQEGRLPVRRPPMMRAADRWRL